MPQQLRPRLSAATRLLPLLRSHLRSAASRIPWSAGPAFELLPIVEAGLFGYELVPDHETNTYISLGCDARGEPVLRTAWYGMAAASPVQLAALNGHLLSQPERAARHGARQRDLHFPDWTAAADAGWAQILRLVPGRPRRPVVLNENLHRGLDEALSVASSHLAPWNPFIEFCGLPNEAQRGFALSGAGSERGELVFQRPDIWMLRWKAPPLALYESWSVSVPHLQARSNWPRRELESGADA
jgi:hypothetical protein